MSRERLYIRSTLNYDGFPEYAEGLGVNVSGLRSELDLGPDLFSRQVNIVSWNAICTFYEHAAKEIGDESLGMRYALNAKPDFSGIGHVIFMGAVSRDIRNFLKKVADYQAIRTNGLTYVLEENFETQEVIGRYIIHEHSAPHRQFLENTIGLAALTARKLIPGFKVKYVSFTHKAASDSLLYEQVFDAPVYFGANENLFVSDMSYYDIEGNQLSVGFRDFALKAYFNGQTKLKPDARRSMSKFVKAILPSILGADMSDIETFAKSLNMHPKKLQRLLKDEGLSFSMILNDVRKELAHSLLIHTDSPITRIAHLLDYSSDRPFTNAFKRWYGHSPTHYRKEFKSKEQSAELPFLT